MNIRAGMISTCVAIVACENAAAATGDFIIDAALMPNSGGLVGYCDAYSCNPAFGAVDNEYLSDGKKLSFVFDTNFTSGITVIVSGFTADPGKAYFDHIVISCVDPASYFPSFSANYEFSPSRGTARWTWSWGDTWFRCMPNPGRYHLSIRD